MRAVWSFWSKPFHQWKGRIWQTPSHHLMAWGLSLRLARRHFAETALVTDTAGKELLVDRLGLSFDHVSCELDCLRHADAGWWALGKLVAYSLQQEPFIHLDTDVFLWKPLPATLLSAPVIAQCPERHFVANQWCSPTQIEALFARFGLTLPAEWEWFRATDATWFREENCGILGGNRLDFLHYYARMAVDLALNPSNADAWSTVHDKGGFNMLLEQFLLSACLGFHRFDPATQFPGISIRHLFPSWDSAFNQQDAARVGFTHLLGDAKSDPRVTQRLERRLAQEDPAFHRHCLRVAQSRPPEQFFASR